MGCEPPRADLSVGASNASEPSRWPGRRARAALPGAGALRSAKHPYANGTLRSLGVRVRGREVSAVYTFEGY